MIFPPKAQPGDRVAVLSPSFAAPGVFPAVHEQAMRRLTEVTGLIPVEYPTTRAVGAPAAARAADVNAAFAAVGDRPAWGGCLEVLEWVLTAGRSRDPRPLRNVRGCVTRSGRSWPRPRRVFADYT